jgi:hypothetical protein
VAVGALSATAGRRWVARRWASVRQGRAPVAGVPRSVGDGAGGRLGEPVEVDPVPRQPIGAVGPMGPVTRQVIGTVGRVGAVAVRQGARRLERAVAGGRADARSRERQLRERWLAPSTRRAAR